VVPLFEKNWRQRRGMSAGRTQNGAAPQPQAPALQETATAQNLNVASAASGAKCVKVSYGRCPPLSITELVVKRARQEPPGVRLAMMYLWRAVMGKLGADATPYEALSGGSRPSTLT